MRLPSATRELTRIRDERSRSITAENPDGEVGAGGQAASDLGVGRKGRPCITVPSGETKTLADIEGTGEIRHIWLTLPDSTEGSDYVLRDLVLRMYWDGEDEPSVEVPVGDFFCSGFGERAKVNSEMVVAAPEGGFNTYFPMPFADSARITIESDHPVDLDGLYFQIDYSLRDELPDDTAYFHAQWRRSNPAPAGEDHTILADVEGAGTFVGTYLAWASLSGDWWGEGEVKFYIDGDDEFPTLCGTGTEDYVGGAWCFGDDETYSTPYLGYPHSSGEDGPVHNHGLYRWHVPDPIRFTEDLRVTVQQIGANHKDGYFERSDDVSSVAYWYQREPHAAFPELPDRSDRRPR